MSEIIRPPTTELPFNEIIRTILSIVLVDPRTKKGPPEEPSETTMHLFHNCIGILAQIGFRISIQDDKFIPNIETILKASGPRRKTMIVLLLSHIVAPTTEIDRIIEEASASEHAEVRVAAALGYCIKIVQIRKPTIVHPAEGVPPHPPLGGFPPR